MRKVPRVRRAAQVAPLLRALAMAVARHCRSQQSDAACWREYLAALAFPARATPSRRVLRYRRFGDWAQRQARTLPTREQCAEQVRILGCAIVFPQFFRVTSRFRVISRGIDRLESCCSARISPRLSRGYRISPRLSRGYRYRDTRMPTRKPMPAAIPSACQGFSRV